MSSKDISIDPAGIVLNSDGSISFRNEILPEKILAIFDDHGFIRPPRINGGNCTNAASCSGDNGGNCHNGGRCTGFNAGECA
jgi:hypothetical protein